MAIDSILFPEAQPGDIHHDVEFDNRLWLVFYERLNNKGGGDVFVVQSLLKSIGNIHPSTLVRFRVSYWDLATEGVPRMPGYGVVVHHGGVLDGTELFPLLLASIEPGALVEWRVSGPESNAVMARIQSWFASLDPASGMGKP